MIVLCRAKCWIIKLRQDENDTIIPIAQRGIRGHIIVYPQRPSGIAKCLPLSVTDIVTPICVILVGSQPPTQEWLQKKASPLIVRKEKVANALAWLKVHNHLYRDVLIDNDVLQSLPDESILPFPIQHIVPNAGIDSTTSNYVPGSSAPDAAQLQAGLNLGDILEAPPTSVPFQIFVVADVDGNAPSRDLRKAVVQHIKKDGGNYIEILHDPNTSNTLLKEGNLAPGSQIR
ncbi:hypothetical protein DFH09DRAFT_1248397 [Mycena vulgaris]|nr:hypothetical protein DFH09DRAFT_1248397 [Mycena vulgaris]